MRLAAVVGLWRLFWSLWRLAVAALRQWLFLMAFNRRQLKALSGLQDGSISAALHKRMQFYGIFWVANISEGLAALRGRPLGRYERTGLTWMSVFIPLFDDWYDHPASRPAADLHHLVRFPEQYPPRHDLDQLALSICLPALSDHAQPRSSFEQVVDAVIESQENSLRQSDTSLTLADIRHLVHEKGGRAVLMAHAYLNDPPDASKSAFLYQYGALTQEMDDVFDLREDALAGIRTLATDCSDIRVLQQDFDRSVAQVWQLAQSSGYPDQAIRRWWHTFLLWVAMCDICFDQLLVAQHRLGGRFDWQLCDRRELVTDMAMWRNRFGWLKAYLRRVSG
jgi:hypothetical protein